MQPTHLDLFSGIGGFSLAFEAEGFKTIGFAETNRYATGVLKKHWPGVPNYGDVRTVPAINCDVITGGFPCQPFSKAGKRRGSEDDRFLWPAMLDVIKRCRPTWVVGENVAGIIDMELPRVLADLEGIGFCTQPIVIPACAVDANHRRDRVWILAYSLGGKSQRPMRSRDGLTQPANGGGVLADSNGIGCFQGQSQEHPTKAGFQAQPRSAQCSQWSTEPSVGRVVDGLPDRTHRIKALGNAIVPQVAQQIARAIKGLI